MKVERIATVLRDAEGLEVDALGAHHLVDAVERLRGQSGRSLHAYADLVAVDAEARGELVAELLVHETSFFRYPASFKHLAANGLERLAARPGPVRVLCAACATGQEAYSVAITLLEAGIPAEIDAFDRSASAIEVARAGRYERGGTRGLDAKRTARWFHAKYDALTVDPEVRARVRFEAGDLLDEARPFAGNVYDAVLCRNLLIYLTESARAKALLVLRAALVPGGVLYVGHAEVLVARAGGFSPIDAASTYACVVAQAGAAKAKKPAPARSAPPARRVAPAPVAASRPAAATSSAPPAPGADALEAARNLADTGRLEEAAARIEAEIARVGPRADHYHLLALVHRAAGRTHEADAAIGRALYLDPRHVGALLLAAVAAEGRGERGTAARLQARARAASGGAA